MSNDHTVALAHHWLVAERGGEKVLQSFSKLFPEADLYTLVAAKDRSHFGAWLHRHPLKCSPLNRFPAVERRYKSLLPFFPWALKRLKVKKGTQVLLTSDASVMKGLQVPGGCTHVCYCHSPPRYLWEMQDTYLTQSSGLGRIGRGVFKAVTPYVREFDRQAAKRVDHFIANSSFVAERIQRCYGWTAEVIYPPVAFEDFEYHEKKKDFYLVVSELVPYKRIDLAIEAFNRSGKRLIVIGDGSERHHLEAMARPNIEFVGRAPFSTLKKAYAECRAFIFPGIEDFGITPLEAQASGSPVIAYAEGGALETVIEGQTGHFFGEQSPEALVKAVENFESMGLAPESCRKQAEKFSEGRFLSEINTFLGRVLPQAEAVDRTGSDSE